MTFHDYLWLIIRRWKEILAITLITMITGVLVSNWKNKTAFETTIFITVGAQQQNTNTMPTSLYENVQAGDQFAETIMGWFKNPSFLQKIAEKSGFMVNPGARKQEKQNVVINFNSGSVPEAQEITTALHETLDEEILHYNDTTLSHFQLGLFASRTEQKPVSTTSVIILALALGSLLGTGYAWFFEQTQNRAISLNEVTAALHHPILETFFSQDPKIDQLGFITAHLKKNPAHEMLIAGMNFTPTKLSKKLQKTLNSKNIQTIELPQEAEKISEHGHLLLVAKLGTSNLEDMQKITQLLPSTFDLVIIKA